MTKPHVPIIDRVEKKENIVLIGMPGAGKSTVGVLLAKTTSRAFVDTDLVIQAAEGRRLQEILDRRGIDAFRKLEARHVLALAPQHAVVATGGSVVYAAEAMHHLAVDGVVVFLNVSLPVLRERLTDAETRGIVAERGKTLEALYEERLPLYSRFADIEVDCDGLGHAAVVERIQEKLAANRI